MPSEATQMDLEGMRLSETSQTKRQALYAIIYTWNLKKYNKVVNIKKKKQTHIYREQTSGYQWGEGGGKGQYRDRGPGDMNYYE